MDDENKDNKLKSSSIVKTKSKYTNSSNKRYTHIYLQEKFLRKIPKLSPSKDVLVIYLYNNQIETIENLHVFPNLTSLNLQNNKIQKLENFKNLLKLKKLYVGRNRISVLEGLETLRSLEELHIEKQYLPDKNPLCLDPRTIFALSESLTVLNISHNNIISLSYLSPLKKLMVINASYNDLDDIKEVCQTIQNWYNLREATFTGNPITKRHRYREDIIANSVQLATLDDKIVLNVTRKFIRNLEAEKLTHASKHNINVADILPDLPRNYPPALQKAASASILKDPKCRLSQDLSVFDESEAVYIAWKTLPKRNLMKTPQRLQGKRNANTEKKRVVINSFPQITNI